MLTACLLLPLFAVPAVAYAASQSVAGIALLSLLGVALHGFVRFTLSRDTEAGFTTGLALAAAFTVDPIAIFYALALGAATWFIAHERFRTERFGAQATVAVIVFPTVFVVLSWMFLEWRFAGAVFGTVAADPAVLTFAEGSGRRCAPRRRRWAQRCCTFRCSSPSARSTQCAVRWRSWGT